MFIFYYAIIVTAFWIATSLYLLINRRKVGYLNLVPAIDQFQPSVVIIIAVRNEEKQLAEALRSVSQMDYNNYRIVVVNDRSTDNTPVIIEALAKENKHISVLHIQELPDGWLGKNHALFQGYQNSDEEWMLFTDADVLFQKDTLSKAIYYCLEKNLDHLTVLPFVKSRSEWLNSVLASFIMMLEGRQRPWAVHDKESKASLGVGAFNLVKRTAYEKAGTHEVISLRPDDDLKLGECIKKSGGKQDALYGKGQIELEWYASIKEFINGLMKNVFSVYNYQFAKLFFAGVIPTLFFLVLPVPVLVFAGGLELKIMAGLILLCQLILFGSYSGGYSKAWFAFMVPFAAGLMVYIMLRGSVVTLKQKGIYWRDSFYPLAELKKNL